MYLTTTVNRSALIQHPLETSQKRMTNWASCSSHNANYQKSFSPFHHSGTGIGRSKQMDSEIGSYTVRMPKSS